MNIESVDESQNVKKLHVSAPKTKFLKEQYFGAKRNLHMLKMNMAMSFETSFQLFEKNHTCVGITTDYMNFHVCGKNHTGVVSTKYMRPVKVFGKNHTCV